MVFIRYTFDGNCKTLHSNVEIIDFSADVLEINSSNENNISGNCTNWETRT